MNNNNEYNKLKILYSSEEIQKRVTELGKQISADYKENENLLIIGVLKGAFVFMSDLIRAMDIPFSIDFLRARSYIKDKSMGEVLISQMPDTPLEGRDILIVEDILDTGLTLSNISERLLKEHKAKRVKTAVFLDKEERRIIDFSPDYRCFRIPDKFIVGYGLDYEEKYRGLPYVAYLETGDNN